MNELEKLEQILGVTNDIQRQMLRNYIDCARTCGCTVCHFNRQGAVDGIDPAKAATAGAQVAAALAEAIAS